MRSKELLATEATQTKEVARKQHRFAVLNSVVWLCLGSRALLATPAMQSNAWKKSIESKNLTLSLSFLIFVGFALLCIAGVASKAREPKQSNAMKSD